MKIRPITMGDFPHVLQWSRDELFCSANGWEQNRELEELRLWWERLVNGVSEDFIRLGVEWEGRLVGYVDLACMKGDEAEFGIAIGESSLWGKRIGFEAAKLALDYASKELGITTFLAETHETNLRSRRLLERIGFIEVSRIGSENYSGKNTQLIQLQREATSMKTDYIDPVVYHTFGNGNKTIILYHGWGSSIRNYIELATDLTELGFRVVLPELPYHDSRNPIENPFQPEMTQHYFWRTIFQSIDEAPQLFEALQVSKEEIILFGSSMGGFAASGIAANHPEVSGLISVNSSGSFLSSERIFRKSDGRSDLDEEDKQLFNAYDPITKNSHPARVLLMHGKQDRIISIEGQQDYYHYLKSRGANVVFQTYEHVNHVLTDEMIQTIKQWLNQHMKE